MNDSTLPEVYFPGNETLSDIFNDPDVQRTARGAGKLAVGPDTVVLLPEVFGFCRGVLQGLRLLCSVIEHAAGRQVWLLGEIIHNPTVNSFFEKQGVVVLPHDRIEQVFSLARTDDYLVIPAFGIPLLLDRRVRAFVSSPDRIVDATCGYVRRIWSFVEKHAAKHNTVIIHGKPDHPETRATLSRALSPENSVLLIADFADAEMLAAEISAGSLSGYPEEKIVGDPDVSLAHLALVNQTTMLYSETARIENVLRQAIEGQGGTLDAPDTVCRATQDRQDAALELCRKNPDVIIVIGGFDSSNTNQLYRLATDFAPTYFVAGAQAMEAEEITHYVPTTGGVSRTSGWLSPPPNTIALLAGASCPPTDIGGVIRRLQQIIRR